MLCISCLWETYIFFSRDLCEWCYHTLKCLSMINHETTGIPKTLTSGYPDFPRCILKCCCLHAGRGEGNGLGGWEGSTEIKEKAPELSISCSPGLEAASNSRNWGYHFVWTSWTPESQLYMALMLLVGADCPHIGYIREMKNKTLIIINISSFNILYNIKKLLLVII